ncbi:pyridoxamine 5'-phosphate oxidase family protein [Streptomyces sp. JH34]|uniref:pyridoxamine 5'-phosphate oxidase family protein n=1 Tax=Streptomyces sp. JH34 TaxID=2793633 RepID=UPI0023F6C921|nr:pyridoxamine 5'-phosphate oxidase family protein [Streptomyces sp. JH34]MDF6020064.1 pyridoxamine 5'-phosphate oxidase family protein [Streptomyces sp. JH34]
MLSSRPSCTGTAEDPGVSGASDASGPSGVSGAPGASGPSGVSGAPGTAASSSSDGADKLRAIELLGSVRYGRLAMSMRALPFLAVARHLVIEGRVVLRMHRGLGFHESCDGSVVAYGADNFNSPAPSGTEGLWSVQFTGPVEIMDPGPGHRARFGTGPAEVNGEHFDPVYLRLDPRLAHMHTLAFGASP